MLTIYLTPEGLIASTDTIYGYALGGVRRLANGAFRAFNGEGGAGTWPNVETAASYLLSIADV